MVQIETQAEATVRVAASRDRVRGLILDVVTSGVFFPDVEAVEALDEARYRFRLKPQRTLGITFVGEYVARYSQPEDGTVRWVTESGNIESAGTWRLGGSDGDMQVSLQITSRLDVPVPRLAKKPAELFARRVTANGLDAQLARFKAEAEAEAR